LRGPIGCRLVVLYRVAPDALVPLMPEGMRVDPYKGYAVAGLCYTHRVRGEGPWWSNPPSQGGDMLSLRILAELDTTSGPRPALWIPRRETSSRLSARFAGALLRGEHHSCRAELEQGDSTLELRVHAGDVEELYLRAELAGGLEGSLFAHPREAEQVLGESRLVRPKSPIDALAGESDDLGLGTGQVSAEPLLVRELRARPFDDRELFTEGSATFDSAFRLVRLRQARLPAPARLSVNETLAPLPLPPSA
jgi:hypothetical protein